MSSRTSSPRGNGSNVGAGTATDAHRRRRNGRSRAGAGPVGRGTPAQTAMQHQGQIVEGYEVGSEDTASGGGSMSCHRYPSCRPPRSPPYPSQTGRRGGATGRRAHQSFRRSNCQVDPRNDKPAPRTTNKGTPARTTTYPTKTTTRVGLTRASTQNPQIRNPARTGRHHRLLPNTLPVPRHTTAPVCKPRWKGRHGNHRHKQI